MDQNLQSFLDSLVVGVGQVSTAIASIAPVVQNTAATVSPPSTATNVAALPASSDKTGGLMGLTSNQLLIGAAVLVGVLLVR